MYPRPPRGRLGRSFEVGFVGRSPFGGGTRQQALRGPVVWRPRRFVSYGLVFQALILRTISGCVAQSHLTGKQALRLYFAAQLIFLCEDVVFRAKPSSRASS